MRLCFYLTIPETIHRRGSFPNQVTFLLVDQEETWIAPWRTSRRPLA